MVSRPAHTIFHCFGFSPRVVPQPCGWNPVLARASTDGDERDLLPFLIPCYAGCLRVEHWLTIDQEVVAVVAMAQGDLKIPPAVDPPLHRAGARFPMVEVADQENGLRVRRLTKKVDGFDAVLRRISLAVRRCVASLHKQRFNVRQRFGGTRSPHGFESLETLIAFILFLTSSRRISSMGLTTHEIG